MDLLNSKSNYFQATSSLRYLAILPKPALHELEIYLIQQNKSFKEKNYSNAGSGLGSSLNCAQLCTAWYMSYRQFSEKPRGHGSFTRALVAAKYSYSKEPCANPKYDAPELKVLTLSIGDSSPPIASIPVKSQVSLLAR